MFEQLRRDVREGYRALRAAPLSNATIICLVAVVVGGNTTIFGLVHALLTKPARGVAATELMTVQRVEPGNAPGPLHQLSDFESFRDSARTLGRIAAVQLEPLTLRVGINTDTVRGASVTPGYFELFGISLLRGHTFSEAKGQPTLPSLPVIISESLWHTRFDGRPDIFDQPVYVNGQAATIVGVVPAAFRGATLGELTDVWLPLRSPSDRAGAEGVPSSRPSVQVFARLIDGGSRDDAQAELSLLMAASHHDISTVSRPGVALVPYSMTTAGDSMIAQLAPRFLTLFSVVTALTLVIICANIANLVWARGLDREREMAMRAAMGATRWQLIRAVAAETLMVGALAWTAASVAAAMATRLLVQFLDAQSGGALSIVDVGADASVLAYAGVLALGTVAVCAAVPALRLGRTSLNTIVGSASAAPRRSRGATFLIVTQLALSVVLLVLSGLAYRSVSGSLRADLGFDPTRVHLIRIDMAGASNAASHGALLERIRQAVQDLPEVEAASHANTTPAVRGRRVAVSASAEGSPITVDRIEVGPEFFRTLGVVPWQGREFSAVDIADQRPVTIVNRSVADRLWAGRSNVASQTLVLHDEVQREVEVVGVVPDGLFTGPRGQAVPAFVFLPSTRAAEARSVATLYARVVTRSESTAATLRRAIGQVEPLVAIASISTMGDAIDTLTVPQRMVVRMATAFAAACLVISAIGLYGLVSFTVNRRRREFGVRQAIGASRAMLLRLVLGEALTLTVVGVACGFVVGGGIAVTSRSYLFGIGPLDLITYAGIATIVGLVAVVATCGPALRAARVDPVVALRTD